MSSSEANKEEFKSSRVSQHLYYKNEKEAEKIVEKAASDRTVLERIISEYREGFWTFSKDDDAIWFFRKVVNASNDEPIKKIALTNLIIARNKKAWEAIREGQLDDAQRVLTESFNDYLIDSETHLFYSVLLRKIGLEKPANCELEKYLNFKPENDYGNYALMLHMAGLSEEAKTFFDQALKSPKNKLNTYVAYIAYLEETSQYQIMLDYCKKIDSIDPGNPETYHDFAFALTNLGRYKEAIDYLWKCIEHANILDDDVSVMYSDLTHLVRTQGKENYKRAVAREICNLVTFQMNSTSSEEIEKVKRYFPKDYYWTMFYNGCIRYIDARRDWFNREWDFANESFYRAEIRFDMSDESSAMGHTSNIWHLFSVDKDLNELFGQIDVLERKEILDKIDNLSRSLEQTPRQDKFGLMINGYRESLNYLNGLMGFFRKEEVKIDSTLISRIRKGFAESDFSTGFDMLDTLRKMEMYTIRETAIAASQKFTPEEKEKFYDDCWEEMRNYLKTAIIALDGPSIYEMVRNGDRQFALSGILKEKTYQLETNAVLNTATEKELIEDWRTFRDAVVNKRNTTRKRKSLVNTVVDLWGECNEIAYQKKWRGEGSIFKPTTKTVAIPLKLYELKVSNRDELGDFIKMLYIWIVESSANGMRIPSDAEISHYLAIVKNLRHHFEHDREHGKQPEIQEKFVSIGRIFEELIGKQPSNKNEWYLLQIAILLRAKALLTLILSRIE